MFYLSFAHFTRDVISNISLFMVTPTFFHKIVLPYIQSSKKYIDSMLKYIAPVVRERREKMRLAKLAGTEHGLVENFL